LAPGAPQRYELNSVLRMPVNGTTREKKPTKNYSPLLLKQLDTTGNTSRKIYFHSATKSLPEAGTVESIKSKRKSDQIEESLSKKPKTLSDEILPEIISPIPIEEITQNRIPIYSIRLLPKQENYEPGICSPILYLKNLHKKVTQKDLLALFLRFQSPEEPPLRFRLMNGKMSGQAFVYFPSCEKAQEAFSLINGYVLYSKPIIIQYGKGDH
jgi:hypothetical protein